MKNKEYYCKTKGPDFIIIGAMKAATSGIYKYLNQHPQVLPCIRKEMHFFSKNYSQGMEWYLSHFYPIRENFRNGKIYLTGEASPSYLWNHQAPLRLINDFPNVKVIVSLRNPIDRAVSHYYHQVNNAKDKETCSLEQALDLNDSKYSNKYLKPGKYVLPLKRWLDIFSTEKNFLILRFEDLISEPVNVRKKLFNFLELPDKKFIDMSKKVYTNEYPPLATSTRSKLAEFYRPYNQELEEFLGMSFNWD